MDKKSWVCTLIIQLALCLALYCAINIQSPTLHSHPNQIYFISVRGGFRPLKQQTRLIKQIEKVIYAYRVGFVLLISEPGKDYPLLQNATQYFHSMKIPWYTTKAPRGQGPYYFFQQVNISSGRTLDIIALDTEKIQDFSSGMGKAQLKQLSRKLDSSNSHWRIAVGFHPVFCNQSLEQTQTQARAQAKGNDVLHQIFLEHGVDAYLSGQSCAGEGGPYLTTTSEGSYPPKEMVNMFLLHRVSPLEIVTYGVNLKGDMVQESSVRQRGREAM